MSHTDSARAADAGFALAVVAGGTGTRMGGPKHGLHLGNRSVLHDLLDRLHWAGPTLLVLGVDQARPAGAERFDQVVSDAISGQGPVRGILTAINTFIPPTPVEHVVCVPVDMPCLSADHVAWLMQTAQRHPRAAGLLLSRDNAHVEPFPCVFRLDAADAIASFLESGRRALRDLANLPKVITLPAPPDWSPSVWTNLNTPDDVRAFTNNAASSRTADHPPIWAENTPTHVPILRWNGHLAMQTTDDVAPEDPLEIRVRGRSIAITMRSPGHDEELAVGFLLTEGVIKTAADIDHIEPCSQNQADNVLNVRLAPLVHLDIDRLSRHVFTASSCGLCGKATIDAIQTYTPPIESDLQIDAGVLSELPARMRDAQCTFDRTGGLHAAALFNDTGTLLVAREDIGRHNAVDKVVGHALMHGLDLRHAVLLVSGRSSFEIMQKAAAARIPLVAGVSAPSSLAVAFAQAMNQTLVGFLRKGRMNVYAHAHRVRFVPAALHPAPAPLPAPPGGSS